MEEKLASQTTTSGYAVSPAFAFQPEVRSTAQEWQWNADPYSTGINVTTASYRAFFPLPPQTPHFKSSDNLPQHKKEAVPYCGSEEVAAHNYKLFVEEEKSSTLHDDVKTPHQQQTYEARHTSDGIKVFAQKRYNEMLRSVRISRTMYIKKKRVSLDMDLVEAAEEQLNYLKTRHVGLLKALGQWCSHRGAGIPNHLAQWQPYIVCPEAHLPISVRQKGTVVKSEASVQKLIDFYANTVPSPAAGLQEAAWKFTYHNGKVTRSSFDRYTLHLRTGDDGSCRTEPGRMLPWLYVSWDPRDQAYRTYTARMITAGSPVLFVTGTILYQYSEPYKHPQSDLDVEKFQKRVFKKAQETGENQYHTVKMSRDVDCLDTYLDAEGRCTIVHSSKDFGQAVDRLDLGCGHQFLDESPTGNIRMEADGVGYAIDFIPADCKLAFRQDLVVPQDDGARAVPAGKLCNRKDACSTGMGSEEADPRSPSHCSGSDLSCHSSDFGSPSGGDTTSESTSPSPISHKLSERGSDRYKTIFPSNIDLTPCKVLTAHRRLLKERAKQTEEDTEGETSDPVEDLVAPNLDSTSQPCPVLMEVVEEVRKHLTILVERKLNWSKFVDDVMACENGSYLEVPISPELWMNHQEQFTDPKTLKPSQFASEEIQELRSFLQLTKRIAFRATTSQKHLFTA